jgi:hypothetical protein
VTVLGPRSRTPGRRAPRAHGAGSGLEQAANPALDFVGEDDAGGLPGDGSERVEGRRQFVGRRPPGESGAGPFHEESDQVVDGPSETPGEQVSGLARDLYIDPRVMEAEREVEERRTLDQPRPVVLARQVLGPFETSSYPRCPGPQQICQLVVVDKTRPVLGPGAPQGGIQSQPVTDRDPRAHAPVEQGTDPGEGETAILEFCDHAESVEMVLAVDRRPAAAVRPVQHPDGLVEADGPRRQTRSGGQLGQRVGGRIAWDVHDDQ